MAMPIPTRVVTYGASRIGVISTMVLAYHNQGINFTVVDEDATLIQAWKNHQIDEPGLNQLGHSLGNISFTSDDDDINRAIVDAHVIFLAVEKHTKQRGIGKNVNLDLAKWVKAVDRIMSVTFALGPKRTVERFPVVEVGTNHFIDFLKPSQILIAPKFPTNADTTFFNNHLYAWAADAIVVSDSKTVEFTTLVQNFLYTMQLLDMNILNSLASDCGVDFDNALDLLSNDDRLPPNLKSLSAAAAAAIGRPETQTHITCVGKLAREYHQQKIFSFCESVKALMKRR